MGYWRSWERATFALLRPRVRIPYTPLLKVCIYAGFREIYFYICPLMGRYFFVWGLFSRSHLLVLFFVQIKIAPGGTSRGHIAQHTMIANNILILCYVDIID